MHVFNSLWPIDAMWRHRSGSALAQIMACCLTTPSPSLNWWWFIIKGVLWYSPHTNFKRSIPELNPKFAFVDDTCKIAITSPWGQWVNLLWPSDSIWWQRSGNTSSDKGLLSDSTKSLPELMLTDYQWSPVTFIFGQFHKSCLSHQSLKSIWKLRIQNFIQITQELMS